MDGKGISAVFRSGCRGLEQADGNGWQVLGADAGQPGRCRCHGWQRYANCLLCVGTNIINVNTQR